MLQLRQFARVTLTVRRQRDGASETSRRAEGVTDPPGSGNEVLPRRAFPGLSEAGGPGGRPGRLGESDPRSGRNLRRLVSSAPVTSESSCPAARGGPELGPSRSSAEEFRHQENFSAKEALPAEGAWVPCPDVNPWRGSRSQAPPAQGSLAPDPRASAVKTKHRLRRSTDFRAVRSERKGAGEELLRVQVRANFVGRPRVGIVVSKQIGGAVERNRLRRRLRAAAAEQLPWLGLFDVVLLPQPMAAKQDWTALRASLARCLARAGVIQ